jgi:hypothetical protein
MKNLAQRCCSVESFFFHIFGPVLHSSQYLGLIPPLLLFFFTCFKYLDSHDVLDFPNQFARMVFQVRVNVAFVAAANRVRLGSALFAT